MIYSVGNYLKQPTEKLRKAVVVKIVNSVLLRCTSVHQAFLVYNIYMENESLLFIGDCWRRVCYCDPVISYWSIGDLLKDVTVLGTKPHVSPSHECPKQQAEGTFWVGALSLAATCYGEQGVLCQRGRRVTTPVRANQPILLPTHTSFPLRGLWMHFPAYYFKSTTTISIQASVVDPVDPEPFRRMVDDISKQLNLMVMMIRRSQVQKSCLNPGLSNCHITFEMPGTWGEERNMFSSILLSYNKFAYRSLAK